MALSKFTWIEEAEQGFELNLFGTWATWGNPCAVVAVAVPEKPWEARPLFNARLFTIYSPCPLPEV